MTTMINKAAAKLRDKFSFMLTTQKLDIDRLLWSSIAKRVGDEIWNQMIDIRTPVRENIIFSLYQAERK